MSRLLVLCEGQTEETFFNLVLREHLAERGIFSDCTMICTAREDGRRIHRGGHAHRWNLIERDIRLLLRSNPVAVTTMLDLYAFPKDLPGFPALHQASATAERVGAIAEATAKVVNDARFILGLLVHEFEGLLFSGPEHIAAVAILDETRRSGIEKQLRAVAEAFATPEDINDSPQTAPSKRLLNIVEGYRKPRHGPVIAARVGLAALRERCPLFSA